MLVAVAKGVHLLDLRESDMYNNNLGGYSIQSMECIFRRVCVV